MTGPEFGVVVIGRNEGARLLRCLASVAPLSAPVVYVDSDSSDGSADAARGRGADVVSVDPSRPMSAARSRNEGFERLLALAPGVRFVQFVDGDCELDPAWTGAALHTLASGTDAAVVTGGLRERDARSTVYGRLAAMEWSGAPGDVDACGGVSMMRAEVFRATGGFRTDSIGGEEPELCLRIRRAGWRIVRTADPMAVHDAAISRFGQWWRRAVRSGYAVADGAALHGRGPERYNVRERASALLWGAAVPLVSLLGLLAGFLVTPWAFAVPAAAGCLVLGLFGRILASRRRAGNSVSDAALYAGFCVLAKVPQALGVARRALDGLTTRRSAWIEYKEVGGRSC